MNTRKKSPWFALYPDDFLGSIAEMDNDALGLYFRLLLHQSTSDSIPDPTEDERSFCRAAGCFPGEWQEAWEQVGHKFQKCEDGRLRNPRLERELAIRNGIRDARIQAGKKGNNAKRSQKGSQKGSQKVQVCDTQKEPFAARVHVHDHDHVLLDQDRNTHTPPRARPSLEDVEKFALNEQLDSDAAIACFHHYEATATPSGWINGSGNSLQWHATVRRWVHDDKRKQIATAASATTPKRGTRPPKTFDPKDNII